MSAQSGELDISSFWQWSLTHYARDHVAQLLLHLQDEYGFNVNIALWCCWIALAYDDAPEFALRGAIERTEPWSAGVTRPLRQVRRYLKAEPSTLGQTLRQTVKEAELAAEKEEQARLETLAKSALSPLAASSDPRPRARRNLAAYSALIGAAKKNRFTVSQLEALIDCLFAQRPSTGGDGDIS